jgi:hypothetical protein
MSPGYHILFWNLGILILAEQINIALRNDLYSNREAVHLVSIKAGEYEASAISSVVAMSRHINNISTTHGYIRVSSDSELKLPFISHHARLAPVVTVLSKTIEHLIQQVTSTDVTMFERDIESMHKIESTMLSIKTVLICLLDMDATVAGARSARPTIRKLMSSHSDVLMDCWAVDGIQTSHS